MLKTIVQNLFGSRNDRLLKEYGKKVTQINALGIITWTWALGILHKPLTEQVKSIFGKGAFWQTG